MWRLHERGWWVLIPTNTVRRADGTAVMGAGVAAQAAARFPELPGCYGAALAAVHRRVVCADLRLLLVPTKEHWRQPARLVLVEELLDAVARFLAGHLDQRVALPAPGCGLGGLDFETVRAAAELRLAPVTDRVLPLSPR